MWVSGWGGPGKYSGGEQSSVGREGLVRSVEVLCGKGAGLIKREVRS